MKNHFAFISLILMLAFTGILSTLSGQWMQHRIDDDLGAGATFEKFTYVTDLDGDGDVDVIATSYTRNKVVWYENNNLNWTTFIIDDATDGPLFPYVADIDGDDTLDVIVTFFRGGDVIWYKNNHPNWNKNIIDENLDGAEFIIAADIDKDNDVDVIVGGQLAGVVVWYENNDLNWTRRVIANLSSPMTIAVGDLDGDDTLDVVANSRVTDKLVWYKNKNGGQSWIEYTIDDDLDGSFAAVLADINDDDKLDVVSTGKDANDVVWYENHHPTWNKYTIDENLIGAHQISVADLDGDLDLDVAATALQGDVVVWYENNNLNWTRQYVDAYLDVARILQVADIDGDSDQDLVVTSDYTKQVVWYENPLPIAYGRLHEVYPKYISPQGDTLFVRAHITNPENHPVTVYAKFHGDDVAFIDSLFLYDDGMHDDENANDNLWGGTQWLSGLQEDMYMVDLYTHDLPSGVINESYLGSHFSSEGPIKLENYTINGTDTIIDPGDIVSFKLTLKNNGLDATAENISATITTEDSCVFIKSSISPYKDIPPGLSEQSLIVYSMEIASDCPGGDIAMNINIASKGYYCWSDSFSIYVEPATLIEKLDPKLPMDFALQQNYPNPFNPTTGIRWQLPAGNHVKLSIYNILGQKIATLINKSMPAGYHEVEFNGQNLPSGIYLYKIEAGTWSDVKKMILIK